MKKTIVTYVRIGCSTRYTHTLAGHLGKDYAQLAMLKKGIGCTRVLSVEHV
jgi:hypothetical protein